MYDASSKPFLKPPPLCLKPIFIVSNPDLDNHSGVDTIAAGCA